MTEKNFCRTGIELMWKETTQEFDLFIFALGKFSKKKIGSDAFIIFLSVRNINNGKQTWIDGASSVLKNYGWTRKNKTLLYNVVSASRP